MKITRLLVLCAWLATCPSIFTAETTPKNSGSDEGVSPEIWQQLADLYQTTMDQTQQIEFCLQTVAQIINNGKISVNTKIISKSQLVEQIRHIEQFITSFIDLSQQASQYGAYGAIIQKGCAFNIAAAHYLITIFNQDINTINVQDFQKAIEQALQESDETMDNTPVHEQMQAAQQKVNELISASENVGLSTFNKIYRYLDRKPLPITGKSTFATMGDLAILGGLGVAAYAGIIYFVSPEKNVEDYTFGLYKTAKELPGKDPKSWFYIGEKDRTAYKFAENVDPKTKQEKLGDEGFGIAGNMEAMVRYANNPLAVILLPTVAAAASPYLQKGYNAVKNEWNKWTNYYGNGDVSAMNSDYEYTKAYFKDIVGGEELEREAKLIADYIKNPTRYERQGNSPATGYLLVGPSQTGKSYFARALRTLIDEQFKDSTQKVGFWNVTKAAYADPKVGGFAGIFAIASQFAPVILFIDELDMYGVRRDRNDTATQELLTAMNGMTTNPNKKIIVIAATNKPEELDFALKQKGRFGHIIPFNYPSYQHRKQYLVKQLTKQNIQLSDAMIETISQETDGQTFNMIDDLIRQARQISTYKLRPVTEQDFEQVLDRELRKITKNVSMSDVEQELVATYQAGQAVARFVLGTEQQVVKITIDSVDKPIATKETHATIEHKNSQPENAELLTQQRPKNIRLGYVFTASTSNHAELMSDDEQEKEMMALLAGQAALELVKGKTFSMFGKEDRAKVLDMLEKKISHGTQITSEIQQKAIAAKDLLYNKIKNLLQPHVQFIKNVAAKLVKDHTIDKKQWLELTHAVPKHAATSPAAKLNFKPIKIPAVQKNKNLAVARA